MSVTEITICICAYNEAQNIERSIRSIYSQNTRNVKVKEILVVSSGSTDGTDEIVKNMTSEFDNLTLLPQNKREGKNSAINLCLDYKSCEIVVLLNADNVFGTPDSLYNLITPFQDKHIGMVGGHPIPTNDKNNLIGFAVNTLWTMHHHLALTYPKIGELIAFRDISTRLPINQQSDEDLIRMNLEKNGYACIYAPDAIVLNRGPENKEDFMLQRTRVNIGECVMMDKYGYEIPSWKKTYLFKALLGTIKDLGFHPIKFIMTAQMELKARNIAKKHVKSGKKDLNVWDQVKTTKKL